MFCLCIAALVLSGCSEEVPSVRVTNEYPKKATVGIKQRREFSAGFTQITTGQTTEYKDLAIGRCDVSATIYEEADISELVFPAESDHNYTIVITNTTPPTLKQSSEKK